MPFHPTDRFFARRHLVQTTDGALTDHFDALCVLSEDWVAVGHYFGGEPRWVLGELSIQPTPDHVARALQPDWPWSRGGPAVRPEVELESDGFLKGHLETWVWSRTAVAQDASPSEIYARMVRDVPFEDLRRAATCAANWHKTVGHQMLEATEAGLAGGTDASEWLRVAEDLASIPGGATLTRAQLTYLLCAALFEKHHAANQIRFKIAKELALTTDLVSGLGVQQAQAKVRGWLDGARRLGYLTKHGAGRTAGGLTDLGRELTAKHFPDMLTTSQGATS